MASQSFFDKMMARIPAEITSKEDMIIWMFENGIFIHRDDAMLPFNDFCNHLDCRIITVGKKMAGHPAHSGWNEIAALNKLFGLMCQASNIANGCEFQVTRPKGFQP